MATTVEHISKRLAVSTTALIGKYLSGASEIASSGYQSEVIWALAGLSDTMSDLRANIVADGETIGTVHIIMSGMHFMIFEETESECGEYIENVYLHDASSDSVYPSDNNERSYPLTDIGTLEVELIPH